MLKLFSSYLAIDAINSESGIIVFVGYLVVFVALVVLYLFFRYVLPAFLRIKLYRRAAREGRALDESEKKQMSGAENAAIATALFLYFNEQHDLESNIITIRKVSRTYSPWSSKIHNMKTLQR